MSDATLLHNGPPYLILAKVLISKDGIDHLNTVGGQKYLGTYTQKFLAFGRERQNDSNLMALAAARGVELISLPSYTADGAISSEDREKLCRLVCQKLGRSYQEDTLRFITETTLST